MHVERRFVQCAVEGDLDAAVLHRLLRDSGLALHGTMNGRQGKADLLGRLPRYNQAARYGSWVVLIDLDNDDDCAVSFLQRVIPAREAGFHLRVVTREIEAWLLADRDGIADLLQVSGTRIPRQPEALPDPKRELVNIARESKSVHVQRAIVPQPRSGRTVGSGYLSKLSEFVERSWDPIEAAKHADSLRRVRQVLDRLKMVEGLET